MKSLSCLALFASCAAVSAPVATPAPAAEAQRAHAQGACGKLAAGTGLGDDNKGWVVSMLPGHHEFRVRGGGSAYVTVARLAALDLDAGRPYYIVVEGARAGSVLEWKVPGSDWALLPKYFLYPPQR